MTPFHYHFWSTGGFVVLGVIALVLLTVIIAFLDRLWDRISIEILSWYIKVTSHQGNEKTDEVINLMNEKWPPFCGAESATDPVMVCILTKHLITDGRGGFRHMDGEDRGFWLTRRVRRDRNSSRSE